MELVCLFVSQQEKSTVTPVISKHLPLGKQTMKNGQYSCRYSNREL